jgi:hypothetical protein
MAGSEEGGARWIEQCLSRDPTAEGCEDFDHTTWTVTGGETQVGKPCLVSDRAFSHCNHLNTCASLLKQQSAAAGEMTLPPAPLEPSLSPTVRRHFSFFRIVREKNNPLFYFDEAS